MPIYVTFYKWMNAYIYLFVFGAFNGILIDLLGNLFIFGFGSLGPPYF